MTTSLPSAERLNAVPPSGIVVLDKPVGVTSQRAVTMVKRALGVRKAGHAGTLDPMASGVLVVGLGRATKLLTYITGADKQYEATIRLGQATTTDDADGEPVGEVVDATGLAMDAIDAAMRHYVGGIDQVPSAVSAIKVNGQRAYALVRAGQDVTLAPRRVRVDRFDVLQRNDRVPFVDLDVVVDCSTGTYIRALARDLGRDLGVGGHLVALRRPRVGGFSVGHAVSLDELSWAAVTPAGEAARVVLPVVEVDDTAARDVSFGRALPFAVPAEATAVLGPDGDLLAVYRPADPGRSVPAVVFVPPGVAQ